jgi:hypothetical protein
VGGLAVIEVKCPRCEQYWYTDERGAGKVRLCSDCAAAQRRNQGRPVPADAFLWVLGGVVAAVTLLFILTAVWPRVFGMPMMVFGVLLLLPGMVGLRATMRGHVGEVDWSLARWPMLFVLAGLACMLAYFSFGRAPGGQAASSGRAPVQVSAQAPAAFEKGGGQ